MEPTNQTIEQIDEPSLFARRGIFRINILFSLQQDPEVLFDIFSRCIIIRAEHRFIDQYIEYLAVSPEFEPVEEGLQAPEYEWQITRSYLEDGSEERTLKALRIPSLSESIQEQNKELRAENELLSKEIERLSTEVCSHVVWNERGHATCKYREEQPAIKSQNEAAANEDAAIDVEDSTGRDNG
jgi:hypothetical protein